MLISVILPTYNRVHTLERAVKSVFIQKMEEGLDWELIVVNDGSEDHGETQQLLESLSQRESRMSFISTQNKGVSAARNLGVQHAKGEWIAFLDSDDEWLPEKLQVQYQHAVVSGDVWNQTREIWIRNGTRVNPPKHSIKQGGNLFTSSLERCMITPSSVLIQKNVLEQEGGFDESYPACEDYELWLRLTMRYPIGLVDDNYLIRYGGHSDQLSHKYPAMDQFRIRAMYSLWNKNILSQEQKKILEKVLKQKLNVYQKGCIKRARMEEVEWCQTILDSLVPHS
jgi:glycosyltransferase involved in cell wall biosynthesis